MISLLGFSIQYFSVCLFYYHRLAFVFESQHTFIWKIKHFYRFYRSYEGKTYVNIFLTHLRTRTWRASNQIYSKKWLFWPSKHCFPFLNKGKNCFFQLWTLWSHKRWGIWVQDLAYMILYKLCTRSYGYIF